MLIGQNSRNGLINSRLDFWQRETNHSLALATTYAADRWLWHAAAGTGSLAGGTLSRQSGGVLPFQDYFMRITNTSVGSQGGGSVALLQQRIEDVRSYSGKTVTVSVWMSSTIPNKSVSLTLSQNFGSGGSATNFMPGQMITLSSTVKRYDVTFDVASVSGKTIGAGSYLYLSLRFAASDVAVFGQSDFGWQGTGNTDFYGAMISEGSEAGDFETAGINKDHELLLCQRYYEKSYDVGSLPGSVTSTGAFVARNSTNAVNSLALLIKFSATKRITPAVTLYTTAGAASQYEVDSVARAQSEVLAAIGTTGITLNNTSIAIGGGTARAHYTADAEL